MKTTKQALRQLAAAIITSSGKAPKPTAAMRQKGTMNKRIDYKFKELVLRMLLMIAIKLGCKDDPTVAGRNFEDFEREVRETFHECEAISDGRQ